MYYETNTYKKTCKGKRKHNSRYAAEQWIRNDIKRGLYEEGDKHPYLCPYEDCQKWHIGADRGFDE
jgi:hypothetical protein